MSKKVSPSGGGGKNYVSSINTNVTGTLEQGAAVDRRQRGANDYLRRAQELDRQISGHRPVEEGPFTKELQFYGDNGRVLIPVAGAFVETSSDAHAIAELCNRGLFGYSPTTKLLAPY